MIQGLTMCFKESKRFGSDLARLELELKAEELGGGRAGRRRMIGKNDDYPNATHKLRQLRFGEALSHDLKAEEKTEAAKRTRLSVEMAAPPEGRPDLAEAGPPAGDTDIVRTDAVGFERSRIRKLLEVDHDFRDIVLAHDTAKVIAERNESREDKHLFEQIKGRLRRLFADDTPSSHAKRADSALKEMGDYKLDGLLYRSVWDDNEKTHRDVAVIPRGGLRSF
jgi:hypothetical protein